MIGLHGRVAHHFVRLDTGHYLSLCGQVPERWTRPLPAEECECSGCRRIHAAEKLGKDPAEVVERALAARWPRGMMATDLRRLHLYLRRPSGLEDVMRELEKAQRVFYVETRSGRKVWAARRVVVRRFAGSLDTEER